MPGAPIEVTIRSIGARGDGIAELNGEQIFVPYTVPGDIVEISLDERRMRGNVVRIISPGRDRQVPPCRHFQDCGGCTVQQLSDEAYLAWKCQLIVTALRHRGLENVTVKPVIPVRRRSRRRAVLKWGTSADGSQGLGFHAQKSHKIVDVDECPIIDTAIESILPKLRAVLAKTGDAGCRCTVHLTKADNGLDIHVTPEKGTLQLDPSTRQLWLDALAQDAVVRLTIDGDILLQKTLPIVEYNGIDVAIPPLAFLQATKASEAALIAYAKHALKKCRKLVDLYCGVGTLSLPLARETQITGFDASKDAVDAFEAAVRTKPGLKFRAVQTRDLERRPLLVEELRTFDAAIIDPPRAGAASQVRELAKSSINRVVMVSCNPTTFARDARSFVDAGFEAMDIQPIDQFLWSDHLEVCATFVRKKRHVIR